MAIIRLDPRYPLAWRTPTAIQIGGRRPLVVLDPVTTAEERMLAALRRGVPEEGLAVHGRCPQRDAEALLERVGPALLAPPPPALSITVRARDVEGQRLAELARTLGLLGGATLPDRGALPDRGELPDRGTDRGPRGISPEGRAPAAAEPSAPRLEAGILIGAHAIPPVAYRDWMRRDLPHIGIVFGESEAQISPVVVPGRSPCLRCAELHRRDADPCWPAVAAQLITQHAAAADDPLLRVVALSTAVRRLREALRTRATGPAELPREARTLCIALDGTARAVAAPPHPECGCLVDLQLARRAAA